MNENDKMKAKTTLIRRRQFGLKHLLMLTLLVAAGVVVWQKFFYVHPAHRNRLYEKAPYSRNGEVVFGDVQIAMESVARNDRSGSVQVEDGFGAPVKVAARNGMALKNSGPWLDAAQVQLSASGGSFEVLEARVFDFETRQMIDEIERRSGCRMSGPTTLQINRMGTKLPDLVDVFLRVLIYSARNKPVKLKPQEGASCKYAGGTIEIRELVRGMKSYGSKTGIVADPSRANSEVVVMLQFRGNWPSGHKMKIAAVKKDGTRVHRDSYVRFPGAYYVEKTTTWDSGDAELGELVKLSVGLDDISHFEVRPFEGQHVFFFEGVQLPKTSAAKFVPPPTATVQVGGVETTVKIHEFEPLDVQITTMKGDAVQGSSSDSRRHNITLRAGGAKDVESKTTVVDRVRGASEVRSVLTLNPGKSQTTINQSGSMWGGGRFLRYSLVPLPIDEVESIQVQLPAQ